MFCGDRPRRFGTLGFGQSHTSVRMSPPMAAQTHRCVFVGNPWVCCAIRGFYLQSDSRRSPGSPVNVLLAPMPVSVRGQTPEVLFVSNWGEFAGDTS